MASSPITSSQIDGEKMETVTGFIFLGSKITADGDCSHDIKRPLLLGRNAMTNLDSVLKRRDITLLMKFHIVKAIFFSSSHVWTLELDHKESWGPKNWYFQIVVPEKTPESPLDWKYIKLVNPKENQPWIFVEKTDLKFHSFGHLTQEPTHWKRPSSWEGYRAEGWGGSSRWEV